MGIFKRITPTDLLTLIKTVDGSGSGLDSDLLRGSTPAQVVDNNLGNELTGFKNLGDTAGFLKKTGDGTYTIDTASYLTANQSITVSGDASGSGSTAISLTLANSGVSAGTYNSATQIVPFTVDAKGRITSVGAAVNIAPTWSSIASKPTTLSGFGITDGLSTSGGTISGNLAVTGTINSTKIGRGVDATSLKVGDSAANSNTTGQNWTALGHYSGYSATSHNWTAVGAFSAALNTSGQGWTAVGMGAGYSIGLSDNWTAVGLYAGRYRSDGVTAITASANSCYFGANTKGTQSSTNENVFGYNAIGNGSNTVTIGDTNITDSYIRGKLRIPDTTASTSTTTGSGIFGGGLGVAENLNIGGFSSFGGTSGGHPAIKFKLVEGTTGADGSTTNYSLGVTGEKIQSVNVLIRYGTVNEWVGAGYTSASGYQFNWSTTGSSVTLDLVTGNSANIAGKAFKVLISYIV